MTMFQYAQKAGLSVELLDGIPQNLGGWLDPDPSPRFIGVNRNLPQHEQVFIIARELGYFAQDCGQNSALLDQPWKWHMLSTAPESIGEDIYRMDAEFRGFWLMLWFATGDEFRAFVNQHPGKLCKILFYDNIVTVQLYRLRVKSWLRSFFNRLALI